MYTEVHQMLTDTDRDWISRRLRLQGWRGEEVRQAAASGGVDRVGPAFCAVGSVAATGLHSWMIAAVLAVTSLIGVVAANHPVEAAANALASRRGVRPLPPNRAAKRLGCALGTLGLGGAAVAFASGHDALGVVLAGSIGATATFVAVTNVCVPSVIFTVLWGAERAQAPSLLAAASRRRPESAHGQSSSASRQRAASKG